MDNLLATFNQHEASKPDKSKDRKLVDLVQGLNDALSRRFLHPNCRNSDAQLKIDKTNKITCKALKIDRAYGYQMSVHSPHGEAYADVQYRVLYPLGEVESFDLSFRVENGTYSQISAYVNFRNKEQLSLQAICSYDESLVLQYLSDQVEVDALIKKELPKAIDKIRKVIKEQMGF